MKDADRLRRTAAKRQEIAAERVKHLPAYMVTCRYCGEQSASGSFKGYAHKWGPTTHRFMAKAPSRVSTFS